MNDLLKKLDHLKNIDIKDNDSLIDMDINDINNSPYFTNSTPTDNL
jgi:hypothetical protein